MSRRRRRCDGLACRYGQPPFVPVPDLNKYENSQQRGQCEPADRGLTERNHDQSRQQRPHSASRVAADLKDRLCQSFAPARGELRYPRGFRMENRRTAADQADRRQNKDKAGGYGQREQSGQRETHPYG